MSHPPTGFVAGATGYTGRATVQALLDEGCRAVAHVRPDSSRLDHWRAHFAGTGAEVDTTPWDEDAMRSRLHELRPAMVFSLLGTTKRRARAEMADGASEVSYETIDYGLTALLRRAAGALEPAPVFVYLSSAGVGPSRPGSYMHARWKVEQELASGSMPFVIVRPSIISGSRDDGRPLEHAGAVLLDGALGLAGMFGARTLRDRYRSIDNLTLGRALVRLARDPSAVGTTAHADALR
jgi:uncharacterized protein YbjT (DUF2867 family)